MAASADATEGLDYLERLVAALWNTERKLLNNVSEFKMQLWLFGIELRSDGAD